MQDLNSIELNKIYCCDCIEFMKRLPDECVDLIYADPPFYMRKFFNEHKSFNEYLEWSKLWLKEVKRIMTTIASIYVHCDPIFSHYLKIIMDEIFKIDNCINEIVWSYKTGGVGKRWFARKHDTLLFYAKSNKYTFNLQKDKSSVPTLPEPHTPSGKRLGILRDEGGKYRYVVARDVWEIDALFRNKPECVGYPTQKPEALLERIIKASSNEGDLVFDPFMGSGTTALVCKKLGRNFIGCDINLEAVDLANRRLESFSNA